MASVYDIAVKLNVSSNHKEVLGSLLGMLGSTGAAVDKLLVSVGGLKGAFAGLAAGAAFAGGVSVAKTLITHGDTLLHQQALMVAAGMSQQEIAEATTQAWKTSQEVMGSNVAENLQSIRELRGVFGDTKDAIANVTELTKAKLVIGNMLPSHNADEDVFNFAKALEIKGVSMDPEHFNKLLNMMVQASLAMGGKINGADFLSALKFGRTATMGWSDDFVGLILPTLMQEMKSSGLGGTGATGPGNALMSAFQEIVGGTMSNKVAEEMAKMGLLDPSKIIRTKTGSIKGVKPGGVSGSSEFQANPYQWVQEFLVPALKAHGITTPDAIREEIAHLFGTRTAQQIMTMFATQQVRFEKDAKLNQGAQGINAAKTGLDQNDPTQVMKNFTEAWNNLLVALGEPLARGVIPIMQDLTKAIQYLSAEALAHPDIAKYLEAIGLGIAAWAGLATVLKITAAIRGLFAVLAGAEAVTAAATLPAVATGLQAIVTVGGLATLGATLGAVAVGLGALVGATVLAAQGLDKAAKGAEEYQKSHPDETYVDPFSGTPVPGLKNKDIHKQSYTVPQGGNKNYIQLTSYTMLDGRMLARTVSNHQADAASLPRSGTSAFDFGIHSPSPGSQVAV